MEKVSVSRKRKVVGGVFVGAAMLSTSRGRFSDEVTKSLQELMDSNGGTGCVATGWYTLTNGSFIAVGVNSGTRRCIASDHKYDHDSDNADLTFSLQHVYHCCYIEQCKGASRSLGKHPASLRDFFAMCSEDSGDQTRSRHRKVVKNFEFPELLADNRKWCSKETDVPYLTASLYDDNKKIHVVESSCNTGKTTSAFAYARAKNLRVVALATIISQLDAHELGFDNNKEESLRYNTQVVLNQRKTLAGLRQQ